MHILTKSSCCEVIMDTDFCKNVKLQEPRCGGGNIVAASRIPQLRLDIFLGAAYLHDFISHDGLVTPCCKVEGKLLPN